MSYTQEHLQKWNYIVNIFRENLAKPSFESWIMPLKLYSVTSEEVIVTHDNMMAISMINNRYHSSIEGEVKLKFGERYTLKVLYENDVPKEPENNTSLNPKYTFENFVVGPSNNFAYAASLAVAEAPSEIYNPLFIYGDVGLGKTHLMNAIGNYIQKENPMSNIMFTTSERIANDLIDAIVQKKGTSNLRNKMRNVDVLIVDDIQFLSKTNTTQEEFFHTFNDLHGKGKQIIISSDRPPQELPMIEDRLRSRFQWGLTVDIQKPDFETRIAILRKKADEEMIDIPYDVIEYIAGHFDRSIRELEGALTRVAAKAKLVADSITMDLALETLSSIVSRQDPKRLSPDVIIETVAKRFDVDKEDILSKKRNREIALPRQIAIYICREMTDMSTTVIGKAFGGRDHTTVMHSCEKVDSQMKSDFAFKKRVEEMMDFIRSN